MKTYSTHIQNAISSDELPLFVLVSVSFGTTTIRCTSLPYDVLYSSQTYLSDAGLLKFDNPIQTRIVDREAYSLQFVDNAGEIRGLIDAGTSTGGDVEVLFGALNADNTPNLTDVATVYKGVIESANINNDFRNITAVISCASPLADLELVKARYTSKGSQEQFSTTDTAFDNIYEGAAAIKLKWGKV